MPIILLAIVTVAVVFWTLGRTSRGDSAGPVQSGKCRWTPTGNDNVSLGEYYCKTCKMTGYAKGGKPPQTCKSNMRGKGL